MGLCICTRALLTFHLGNFDPDIAFAACGSTQTCWGGGAGGGGVQQGQFWCTCALVPSASHPDSLAESCSPAAELACANWSTFLAVSKMRSAKSKHACSSATSSAAPQASMSVINITVSHYTLMIVTNLAILIHCSDCHCSPSPTASLTMGYSSCCTDQQENYQDPGQTQKTDGHADRRRDRQTSKKTDGQEII